MAEFSVHVAQASDHVIDAENELDVWEVMTLRTRRYCTIDSVKGSKDFFPMVEVSAANFEDVQLITSVNQCRLESCAAGDTTPKAWTSKDLPLHHRSLPVPCRRTT